MARVVVGKSGSGQAAEKRLAVHMNRQRRLGVLFSDPIDARSIMEAGAVDRAPTAPQ